jgi:tetratricopeptide (TPR) repeat protein
VGHTALDLGDLDPPDVERLVALRLAVDEAPAELLRFVRTRAGGHPLFVEEVIKALIDAGAVTVTERRVVSMKLVGQDLALPKTLRGLVASRIARLAHEDRATLQAAAILGDPIDLTVLANMLGKGMTWLEHSIARLKERDFVVDRGASELCFASPLVPEIVVDGLTPEAGREMHSAAGQALEVTCGSRAAEHAARIARHFYVAGDRERAANFFVKSGERCLETGQLETAARDYARAIALADPSVREPEELACWLEGLASAVRLVRSAPDAQELSRRVIGRVDQGGAQPVRVRARVAAGRILAAVQQMGESRQRLAEAASIADADEQLMRPVLIADAELATRQGDFKRAFELLEKLRRILRAMSDDQERHRVALHFAHACAALGDRPTALASLAEAEGFLPDDGMAAVERTKVRALVDYFTRDFHSAAVHCEKAIDMGRELGLTYEVMLNLHNFGDILLYLGDLPRAYGALRQSLALCEECGYERLANFNRMFLAYLDGLQGTADAERLLRQGIAYADSKYFTWDVVSGGLLLAKLLDRCGRLDVAREEYEKTRALALSAGHRFVADDCEQALRGLTRGPRSPDLANSSSEESLRLDGLEL